MKCYGTKKVQLIQLWPPPLLLIEINLHSKLENENRVRRNTGERNIRYMTIIVQGCTGNLSTFAFGGLKVQRST